LLGWAGLGFTRPARTGLVRVGWVGLGFFLVLVVVLPTAPLGPLRKCLCTVVLSTSPSHHHFHSPSGGRYQSGCIVFVAMLETVHCFHILHMGRFWIRLTGLGCVRRGCSGLVEMG
jgi:hypothetical protein